jgi:hypothetical protein
MSASEVIAAFNAGLLTADEARATLAKLGAKIEAKGK